MGAVLPVQKSGHGPVIQVRTMALSLAGPVARSDDRRMFIVDLECDSGHRFEGWYETSAEYEEIRAAGDLTCPLCRSSTVSRVLSTGSIRTAKTEARRSGHSAEAPLGAPLEMQRALARVVQWVRRTHEDVGAGFAEEALAIHRGEGEARPIYGTATADEEQNLADAGVPVVKLPIPDIEQN